jgi:L-asparaginase
MRFASEIDAERADLLMPHASEAWDRWFWEELTPTERANWPETDLRTLCWQSMDPEIGKDTTVFLGRDQAGSIGSATSTSGWGWKYPGRLGDSPIIGAGSYADSRFGACACTGVGEMSIRCGTARAVILYMKMGMDVTRAVHEAVDDMRALRDGLIGRVTIHAIDAQGGHCVVAVNGTPDNHYWLWREGEDAPSRQPADIVTLTTTAASFSTVARAEERLRAKTDQGGTS